VSYTILFGWNDSSQCMQNGQYHRPALVGVFAIPSCNLMPWNAERQLPPKENITKLVTTGYCLRGGIIQSVTVTHFLIYCAPNLSSDHFRFIHHSSLLWLQQRHIVAKWGETWWEVVAELCLYLYRTYGDLLTCHRKLLHGANIFTSLWRKLGCGLLSLSIDLGQIWIREPWIQW
jgi:hypothetical protein